MDKTNIKIMVVDDSEIFLKLLKNILQRFGYEKIILWPEPTTVIQELQIVQPQLVLMDTHMPGVFGYSLCKEIKSMEIGRKTGIIGMSDFSYHDQWNEANADIFMEKNKMLQNFDEFKDTIESVLSEYN